MSGWGSEIGGISPNTLTVGTNGKYPDLTTAIAARNLITHTLLTTFTGTSTTSEESRDITADAGDPLAAYAGQHVVIQIAGAGPFIRAAVLYPKPVGSGGVARLRLRYPLAASFVSQSIAVYTPQRVSIFLLPGTKITLPTNTTIPGYTTVLAYPNTTELYFPPGSSVGVLQFSNDGDITLSGLNITAGENHQISATSILLKFIGGTYGEQNDWEISHCNISGPHADTLYFSSGLLYGGLKLHNNKITGYYDVVRLSQHRNFVATENQITSMGQSGSIDAEISVFAAGDGGTLSTYAPQRILIENNPLLQAIYDDPLVIGVDPDHISIVEVRNPLSSASPLIIRNNGMRVRNTVAASATAIVSAVSVSSTDTTQTPIIIVKDNDMEVLNAGTGATNMMVSASTTYLIKQRDNKSIGSGVTSMGTNVVDLEYQAPVFAASYTPNFGLGKYINPGLLTAAMTINNGTNVPPAGSQVTFVLIQDGVGGRNVTWGANYIFPVAWSNVGNTLGKTSTITFTSDGTKLVADGQNVWY